MMTDYSAPSAPPALSPGWRCYVINLPNETERKNRITIRLQALGIEPTFVEGVDGRLIDLDASGVYDSARHRRCYPRDLSRGEIGCCLAHRNVYARMLEDGCKHAVVLEDDALLADDLPQVIDALLAVSSSWDLVRFLGREKNDRASRIIGPLPGVASQLARPLSIPGGAYGYLLNRHAATKLHALTARNWLAIDTLHGMVYQTGLATLSCIPSPVLPNDAVASCIDTQDDGHRWKPEKHANFGGALAYPFTRGAWKFHLAMNAARLRLATWLCDRKLGRQLARMTFGRQ